MDATKSSARIAGILFIIASAAAIIGGLLLMPTQGPEYLVDAAAHESQVVGGILLELVQTIAVIGVAVMLFPILRHQHEGMALGFVGARTVEGVFVLAGSISAVLVLALSQTYGPAGTSGVEPLGDVLLAARQWAYLLGPMVAFSVSALVLNAVLFQSRLVPTWISAWGFLGAALLLVSALLEMFGKDLGGSQVLFSAPIGINEMVLAVWLIVKGFETPTPEPEPEREPLMIGA